MIDFVWDIVKPKYKKALVKNLILFIIKISQEKVINE